VCVHLGALPRALSCALAVLPHDPLTPLPLPALPTTLQDSADPSLYSASRARLVTSRCFAADITAARSRASLRCCCRAIALSPSHPHFATRAHPLRPLALRTDRLLACLALASFARPMAFYVFFALLALCSGQYIGSISLSKPTSSSDPCATQSYVAGLPWASGWAAPPLDSCQCAIANLQIRFLDASARPIAYVNGVNATVTAATMYGWGLPGVCGPRPTCQAATANYFAGLALSGGAWSSACSGNPGWMCVSSVPNPNTWSGTLSVTSQIAQVVLSGDNRLPTTTVSFYDTASALMQSAVLLPRDCCTWTFNFTAPTASPSLTPSRSPSPSPTPCSAPPGSFCSLGSVLTCPIGAYCAGGSALNVSCYPLSACTVAGLSAQPLCYWNVSTLAGSGVLSFLDTNSAAARFNTPLGLATNSSAVFVADNGNARIRIVAGGMVSTLAGSSSAFANGAGTQASFANVQGILFLDNGSLIIGDTGNNRIRRCTLNGVVSTLAGNGAGTWTDGIGTSASFYQPVGISLALSGTSYVVADTRNHRIRLVTIAGSVSTLAGSGVASWADGLGTSASFRFPVGIATSSTGDYYVADQSNYRLRKISISGMVSTVAGSGVSSFADGIGILAGLSNLRGIAIDRLDNIVIADGINNRIRFLSNNTNVVTTIAGQALAGQVDGFAARFSTPAAVATNADGIVYVADSDKGLVRTLACVPCPASYFCSSGAPVLCPPGSCCPLSSIDPTLCPKGAYSNAGASNCTLCPAGTFTSATGSMSCQQCPGGHYCPPGTSSWARLNCGRGNYCPNGSGAPTPCPYQVPPSGGWGALQVQGPAFLVETAHCLNHCFWNFTSGDGVLSKC
jgi:hypothetical protein